MMVISSVISFTIAAVGFIAIEVYLIIRQRKRVDKTKDGNSNRILDRAINAAILIGIMFFFHHVIALPGKTEIDMLCGSIIMWTGLMIRIWAILKLGEHFTTIVMVGKDHKLITEGPYRYVRHPAYLGSILVFLGFGVAMGSLIGLILILTIIFYGYLQRINVEERVMASAFGDRYFEFMRRTKRIIPYIY